MPFASETPRATHRVLFAGGIKSPENPSSGSRETLQYGVLQRLSLPKPFPKQKPKNRSLSSTRPRHLRLTRKKGRLTGLERKEAVPCPAHAGCGTASFRFVGGRGASGPPDRGARGALATLAAGGHYFFRFSANSSAMCVTLRPLPSFSAPPRIWSTQPGQSMTTRDAPVSAMPSSFLRSSAAETSGNLAE